MKPKPSTSTQECLLDNVWVVNLLLKPDLLRDYEHGEERRAQVDVHVSFTRGTLGGRSTDHYRPRHHIPRKTITHLKFWTISSTFHDSHDPFPTIFQTSPPPTAHVEATTPAPRTDGLAERRRLARQTLVLHTWKFRPLLKTFPIGFNGPTSGFAISCMSVCIFFLWAVVFFHSSR